jgi:ribosomal protein S18 acetylase RimI-like enzyme
MAPMAARAEAAAIRRATEADFPALSELWREADAFHAAALPERFRVPAGDARPREFVAAELAKADAAVFVAEEAGPVRGFVRVATRHAPDVPCFVPRAVAAIEELVVAAGARRRGLGRALMERAHAWARERGLTEVELSVYAFNAGALALYERLGYTVTLHRLTRRLA